VKLCAFFGETKEKVCVEHIMEQIENVFELLGCRYQVGFSQQTADDVVRLNKREGEFLDIKELNDLAADYRNRLRTFIAAYRAARSHNGQSLARQVYANHETIFMRRQLADLWQVYRILIADSHEMTKDYMQRLRPHMPVSTLPAQTEYRKAA
jgi:hypothetical protein